VAGNNRQLFGMRNITQLQIEAIPGVNKVKMFFFRGVNSVLIRTVLQKVVLKRRFINNLDF